jgi:hypothetical protein
MTVPNADEVDELVDRWCAAVGRRSTGGLPTVARLSRSVVTLEQFDTSRLSSSAPRAKTWPYERNVGT